MIKYLKGRKQWWPKKACWCFFLTISVLLRSTLQQSELVKRNFKPKTLPHCGGFGGKWSATAMCVTRSYIWPEHTFLTALLGLCLNFHMEQEGELMLHYEHGSARAAPNLKQVRQWSNWVYVLLDPGQVEMCYWCITERNDEKESSDIP